MSHRQPAAILLILGLIATIWGVGQFFQIRGLSERQRSQRILFLHARPCGQVQPITKEYGEGTMTARCSNGKVYLIVAREHCDRFATLLCWDLRELNPQTLTYK